MLKAQKKISRKEIKEDKLVTTYFTSRVWIEEHRRIVGYIIGIPIAIIIIALIWTQKHKDWNETATTMLARITPVYEQGKYEEAINGIPQEGVQGLEVIVQEYGSTNAGEVAKYYLANSYAQLGMYDKALEYYDDVDISDPLLSAAAISGKGNCLEHLGKYKEAAVCFEKAAKKGVEVQKPENLLRAALDYGIAGEKEKAVDLLNKLKKEHPNSTSARDAEKFIAQFSA